MNIFSTKHHQTTIVASFISSVIQFDKFFHPVVLYENYLICIFMNIKEKFVIKEKILEKLRDVHIKWQIFHLPCVPVYQSLEHCTFTIRYNMKNIYHEYSWILNVNRRNERKIAEKSRGCTSKITHISVVKCPIVPNLILSQCRDTTCLPKWSNL